MEKIAEALFACGAVHFASGGAREHDAPIYCDVRAALGNVGVRTLISSALAERIAAEFFACEALIGVAVGGVPFAALAAQILALPCGYARVAERDRGLGNRVEGNLAAGARCVIVEDCMVLGTSVSRAVTAARDCGCAVLGAVSVVSFESCAAERAARERGFRTVSLTTISEITGVCLQNGSINKIQAERIRQYAYGWERVR